MAGRDAFFNEMLCFLAQDMEENADEYREISRMMARDGEDPEQVFRSIRAAFEMAAKVQS